MSVQVRPSGPLPARIMIVGEAPGQEEELRGEPFVGASGLELTRMLHEAGMNRTECFITNVCRVRPLGNDITTMIAMKKKDITKEHVFLKGKYVKPILRDGYNLLMSEIQKVRPNIIIAFGNVAMWALTGEWGIMKWRGSMLYMEGTSVKVIPTIHPAAILRQWDLRAIGVQDLRRAALYRDGREYPILPRHFTLRPTSADVIRRLENLRAACEKGPVRLSFDLETRGGHIACAGISWSLTEALCIPLMCVENLDGFWGEEEEAAIVWRLFKLLTHPNAKIVGQNLLYDAQYTYRHWGFAPNVFQDSMISQHVAFAGLKKSLAFQASMYCRFYRYWKDDGKNWDKSMGEDQLWAYNCEDCVRTDEVASELKRIISQAKLDEVESFQQSMFWPVLRAMQLGVKIDLQARDAMNKELHDELKRREEWFKEVLGHGLNPRSPKQMMALFYADLRQPVIMKRAKKGVPGRPTLDDDALTKLGNREPLLKPLLKIIAEYRSIGVFLGTFVEASLDIDNRMRCSYNICGTETYRLSSSENAFGTGTNLQNVPKGLVAKEPEDLSLPNIRKLFVPDSGYTFFDMDLDRADLQVVVWEAGDEELKAMLREGVDIHTENAKGLGISRQLAKTWVHGTNYGGSPRTMAQTCGVTVAEAERMQKRWFEIHPGILHWHRRVENDLRTKRFVTNKFGFRRNYFDRIENLLSEALAWIPQSTVAIVINKIWLSFYRELPEVQVLLQVHDSLAGQFPSSDTGSILCRMRELSRISVPYDDPLTIPVGIKVSTVSWGDCV